MSVTKREQHPMPKRCKPTVELVPSIEIYQPTAHFLCNEFQYAKRHEIGIIRDVHNEFLHQYRVSLRRSRSLISIFHPFFYPSQIRPLKRTLKSLMQPTHSLRDLDVLLMKMEDHFSILPRIHHDGLTQFFDDVQNKRRQAFKELKRWLTSDNYQQQCSVISHLLGEIGSTATLKGGQPAAAVAAHMLWYHFEQVKIRSGDLNDHASDNAIHQLRIRCKKFRYLLAFFSPLLAHEKTIQQVGQLKLLQDKLGDFNDISVQRHFFVQLLNHKKSNTARAMAVEALISVANSQYNNARVDALAQIKLFIQPHNLKLFSDLCPTNKS